MKIIGIITRIISLQAFPVPVTHTWSLREGTTADGREKISGGGDYHYNDNVADGRMMMMKMVTIVIMLRMLFQIGMQGGAEARRCSCLEERGEVNVIIIIIIIIIITIIITIVIIIHHHGVIVTKFVAAAEKIRNKFCFSLLSHNLPIRIANHNHHNYLFYYKMNIMNLNPNTRVMSVGKLLVRRDGKGGKVLKKLFVSLVKSFESYVGKILAGLGSGGSGIQWVWSLVGPGVQM